MSNNSIGSSSSTVPLWNTFVDWWTHLIQVIFSIENQQQQERQPQPQEPILHPNDTTRRKDRITECLWTHTYRQQQQQQQPPSLIRKKECTKPDKVYSSNYKNEPTPTVFLYGTTSTEEHYTEINAWLTKLEQVKKELELQFFHDLLNHKDKDSNNTCSYTNNKKLEEENQRYQQNSMAPHILYRMGFQYRRRTCNSNNTTFKCTTCDVVERNHKDKKSMSAATLFQTSNPQDEEEKKDDQRSTLQQQIDHPQLLSILNESTNTHQNTIRPTQVSSQVPISMMDSFITSSSSSSSSPSLYSTPFPFPSSCSSFKNKQHHHGTAQTILVHIPSNTIITKDNRRVFIADGFMYEEMATLCQHYAQYVMSQEGSLQWTLLSKETVTTTTTTTIINADASKQEEQQEQQKNSHPILAMIFSHPSNTSTLIICTGKGKVKAGIFSRRHLLTTSLEQSTAIPFIHQAKIRNMNIILLDPNIHGDVYGMQTFTLSMNCLFDTPTKNTTITHSNEILNHPYLSSSCDHDDNSAFVLDTTLPWYILSHSASGAQFVRYIMDNNNNNDFNTMTIPLPRAIVFTDSTHNIQWLRQHKNMNNKNIQFYDWLQSSTCLYIRSSNYHHYQQQQQCNEEEWQDPVNKVGETCLVDSFWKHRFGNIVTIWAGTNDHSLSNWYAKDFIWLHFDQYG